MRPLHVAVLALAPFLPLHTGTLHLLTDSIVGVAVGIVVVVLYLLTLRWTTDGETAEQDATSDNREQRSNR